MAAWGSWSGPQLRAHPTFFLPPAPWCTGFTCVFADGPPRIKALAAPLLTASPWPRQGPKDFYLQSEVPRRVDSRKRPWKGGLEPGRGNSPTRLPEQVLRRNEYSIAPCLWSSEPSGERHGWQKTRAEPSTAWGQGPWPWVSHGIKTQNGLPDKLTTPSASSATSFTQPPCSACPSHSLSILDPLRQCIVPAFTSQ